MSMQAASELADTENTTLTGCFTSCGTNEQFATATGRHIVGSIAAPDASVAVATLPVESIIVGYVLTVRKNTAHVGASGVDPWT